jgi:DNA-binding transcriptional ArsR family regulator
LPLLALPVAAAPLQLSLPGVALSVDAGSAGAPPEAPPSPVGVDPVAHLTTETLGAPLGLQLAEGMPLVDGIVLGPRQEAQSASAGPAPERAAALERSSEAAEMAAVGALAAAGTVALKLEPVRRGLLLAALPLYSRLRRSELLENGVRERIYRAVEGQPGLSIIQVCRGATVGWGTAVYHLQRLERDRLIVSRRDGQYRRFYLNGQALAEAAQAAGPAAKLLAHPLARSLAAQVAANPGAPQKDICAALGIAPPLASKWLGRLQQAGLVTSQREWKLVRYAPTPALAAALAVPVAVPAGAPGGAVPA